MKKTIILAGCLLFSVSVAQARPFQAKAMGMLNKIKPIMVKADNPTVTVRLPANPSTGYVWLLARAKHRLIQPVSQSYVKPKESKMGAVGESVWTFKLTPAAFVVPRVIKVTLLYRRPWEMRGGQRRLITFVTR